MDKLLDSLIEHLLNTEDPQNEELLNNYNQFRNILISNMDPSNKVVYIEKFIRSIKSNQRQKTFSYSERKLDQHQQLRHTHSTAEKISLKQTPLRFNNSIVLVETKLFDKKFRERTNEIQQMLNNYEKGLF